MAQAQFVLRLIVLGIYVAVTALCVTAWLRERDRRAESLALLSLGLHAAVFYAALLSRIPFDPVKLNLWSVALRIHEGIMMLVGAWLFLWPARGRR